MSTRITHDTRAVTTRRPGDIDPKIVGVFAVAIATIALVAAAYVIAAVLGADLGPGLATAVVPVLVAAVVGYARTSTHRELIEDGVDVAGEIAAAVAPIVAAQAPQAATVAEETVHGIELVAAALAEQKPA